MEESRYLFDEAFRDYYLNIFVGITLLILSLFLFFKIYKNQRYFSIEDRRQDKLPFALISLLFGIVILTWLPDGLSKFERIRKHYAETIGETIITDKPHRMREVFYRFTVNNKVYFNSAYHYSTRNMDITSIKIPGGRYKVIYNSNDPKDSAMDFNIAE
jgi:hypothetical protein